jgi:peptidoglycan-associated lipoprotein
MINEPKQAEVFYSKAVKSNHPDPLAVLYLADAKKMQEKYAEAKTEYERYIKLVPSDPSGEQGVKSCRLAIEWKENPTRYQVENMAQINTCHWDYCPGFADKKYTALIFSSTRDGATGGIEDNGVGQLYADLFETRLDNKGKWNVPTPLGAPVNSPVNEGASTVTWKGNTMFFTRCDARKNEELTCQLFFSVRKGNVWAEPQRLPFSVDSFNFGHPAVSPDESLLLFSSDMPGGFGGLDLWYSEYDRKMKTWSKPVNLGPSVNTDADEAFPFLHDDGTLYFSSTGYPGMGGYDIFMAKMIKEKSWGHAENMRYPINSSGDDFGIIFEKKKERGYLTSNRAGGKGGDDIYSFHLPELFFTLSGYAYERNKQTGHNKPLAGVKVRLAVNSGEWYEIITDSTGFYRFQEMNGKRCITLANDYLVKALGTEIRTPEARKGYILETGKGQFTTRNLDVSTHFRQDFYFIKVADEIPMPLVLYKLDRWELDHESNPKDSLEYLYKVLTENPGIVIEMASHTDCRNTIRYNDTLSFKRARSCVEYLISGGIPADRLVAKGYGERQPLRLPDGKVLSEKYIQSFKDQNVRERLHQMNRRTVFRVLRDDYVPKEVPSNEQIFPVIQLRDDIPVNDETGD